MQYISDPHNHGIKYKKKDMITHPNSHEFYLYPRTNDLAKHDNDKHPNKR